MRVRISVIREAAEEEDEAIPDAYGAAKRQNAKAEGGGDFDDEEEDEVDATKFEAVRDKPTPCVDSRPLALFMGAVVVCNSLTIGLELEMDGLAPEVFSAVNNGFLLLYLGELFARLLTHGLRALKDPLTVLDLCLVLMTFLERMASSASMARSLPSIRMLRLLRLVRTFRFMNKSKELLVLLSSGTKAMITLFWVTISVFTINWAAAAATHQIIGKSDAWTGSMDPLVPHDPFAAFNVNEYFGSVTASWLTLFQIMCTSQWANHIGRPIIFVYPWFFVFIYFFIMTTTFGFLMCIVSNIVQDSIEASRAFEKAQAEVEKENRRSAGFRAKKILMMLDTDGNAELDEEEMGRALKHKEFLELLRHLEVPVMDAEGLIRLFDKDNSGKVGFNELVEGITGMGEDIVAKDYTKLALWSGSLMTRTVNLEERLQLIGESVTALKVQLEASFAALNHFIKTRDHTELYYRALKSIRNAPPPMPTSTVEALGLTVKEVIEEHEAEELMNFAQRYVSPKDPHARRRPDGMPRAVHVPPADFALRRAAAVTMMGQGLGPAPFRLEVEQGTRQEEEHRRNISDAYTLGQHTNFQKTRQMSTLKELLGTI
eukprot:CAMPEP_0115060360 /NCGR_PEP_ID=MMETSP0227-20121206/7422_1 /TAXON_ID=89957 /ORGANISM="Polarella glacialis, Strain CCMP 1383" /LENGTH=600 /DNA_ID=CAMNT_0002445569 /DNA_START=94 /DNA_END=1896 /DNA_ORIENTATION=+